MKEMHERMNVYAAVWMAYTRRGRVSENRERSGVGVKRGEKCDGGMVRERKLTCGWLRDTKPLNYTVQASQE